MTTKTKRILASAAVAVAAVGALFVWALWPRSEKPFYDYVAAMRAAGEPTTFAEFAGPQPPDAENAAPEIEAARVEVDDRLGSSKWPPGIRWDMERLAPVVEELAPEQRAATEAWADRLTAYSARVAAALERPRCRFPRRKDADGFPLFDDIATASHTVNLLCRRACFAHDAEARLDACRTLARFGNRWETDMLRETEIASGALRGCVEAMRSGVESGAWNPRRVRERLDGALAPSWLSRISRANRFQGVEWIEDYVALLDGRTQPTHVRLGVVATAWWRLKQCGERAQGRRMEFDMEPGRAELIVDLCEFCRRASELPTRSFARFHDDYRRLGESTGFGATKVALYNFSGVLAVTDAEARLARVALALAEFRADHGDFPASLDELKPMFADGVPLDPFTDAPFVYAKTESGARVASVGSLPRNPPLDEASLRSWCLVWELKR